jgi:cell shape-determining protein MreC
LRNTCWTSNVFVTVLLLAAAAGLYFAPAQVADRLRARAVDAAAPWARLAQSTSARVQLAIASWQPTERPGTAATDNGPSELALWKNRCRQLQIEQALLREKLNRLERTAAYPFRPARGQPLVVPDLLEAGVVGHETAVRWRSGAFLDKGAADGLVEDALVLEAGATVLDQGRDTGIAVDQPVYAGRVVVGKIARVGRWISSVQPVTDGAYRAMAQLYRRTPDGMVAGPQGILVGQNGPRCRLTLIEATAAVSEGDEVYTAVGEDTFPYPMYYGSVVKAELKPGALEWDVWVQPASTDERRRVAVLRQKINPARLADGERSTTRQ